MEVISSIEPSNPEWRHFAAEEIQRLKSLWHLSDLKLYKNSGPNSLFTGYQNSKPIILKLSSDREGLKREALALKAFSNWGAVRILDQNDNTLLMEKIIPGTSLKEYFPKRDSEAVEIACEAIQKLQRAKLSEEDFFPKIDNWLKALDKNVGIPIQYLEKAKELKTQLLKTVNKPVLLHGDLHHENILKSEVGWVVIDPKGVIGELAYEVAAFIRNPIPEILNQANPAEIIKNRIALFSKYLNIDEQRIKGWCFVQAVLAWIWALEDSKNPQSFKQLADIFNIG